jgi:hypothetical protein
LPQPVYLYLSSGTSNGPYSVYTSSISIANRLETGLTFAQLQAGRFYSVPDNSNTTFIVTNDNEACGNQQTLTIVAVSPSLTPTPSITATPTRTPSLTPSVTLNVSPTPTPTVTPTRTVSKTPTPTVTRTPSITPTITITPTPTPTLTPSPTRPASTNIVVQLGNDVSLVCVAGNTIVYLNSGDYGTYVALGNNLAVGMTLYFDSYLSTVVANYSYVRDALGTTRDLNLNTGVVGIASVVQC